MCCFSRPVEHVANTRIFARWLPRTKADPGYPQALAYQMEFKATEPLAMILPLPVLPGSGERAVRFIDLHNKADLFVTLRECFPVPLMKAAGIKSYARANAAAPLVVEQVGSFEASYVPSIADFARLDPRFKLPAGTWDRLPAYKDWGFAVFKLRPEATTVHPMAFAFPRREPERGLFFPTVHIHDGVVHQKEEFDHSLYCQRPEGWPAPAGWEESPGHPASVTRQTYGGLLERNAHVFRRTLRGEMRNTDTWA